MLIMTTNNPADWPAVVQAIGSVIVLALSGGVFWLQRRYEQRDQASERELDRQARMTEARRQQAVVANTILGELPALQDSVLTFREHYVNEGLLISSDTYRSYAERIGGSLEHYKGDFKVLPMDLASELYAILRSTRAIQLTIFIIGPGPHMTPITQRAAQDINVQCVVAINAMGKVNTKLIDLVKGFNHPEAAAVSSSD